MHLQVAASSTAESKKKRLRLLANLQSVLDKMCILVPNDLTLAFDAEPTSASTPTPEPTTPSFRTFHAWLLDQMRYVSKELAPIGDHDMDQRRVALLRRLTSEMNRLQQMKETAWAHLLVTHIIQSHMSGTDENGPLCIERSTCISHLHMILIH